MFEQYLVSVKKLEQANLHFYLEQHLVRLRLACMTNYSLEKKHFQEVNNYYESRGTFRFEERSHSITTLTEF